MADTSKHRARGWRENKWHQQPLKYDALLSAEVILLKIDVAERHSKGEATKKEFIRHGLPQGLPHGRQMMRQGKPNFKLLLNY
jgi:hypothetical protein